MEGSFLVVLALMTCSFAVPLTEKPVDDDPKPNYRLPGTTVPNMYTLNLHLPKDVFDTNKYTGIVTIEVEAKIATKVIALHSAVSTTITNVAVKETGKDGKAIGVTDKKFAPDPKTEILTINLDTDLATDKKYLLSIEFNGALQTQDMYGFYKSFYVQDGKTQYLGATQFEPTYARRAFPCYDEPALKAKFSFIITHPKTYNVLFNTPVVPPPANVSDSPADSDPNKDDLVTDTFVTTPRMATYLVAFVVSNFTNTTSDQKIDKNYNHTVWSADKSRDARELAAKLGPKLFKVLEDFTTIHLVDQELTKVDQVAIPDFSAGAMENWGLITYREATLLADGNTSTRINQTIATVIAHELTHQWFGDLVTLAWWNETWLNEGFATYFEYHAAAEVDELKNNELQDQFVTSELQTAMAADADVTAHPISDNATAINTQEEISAKFDSISYNKAGSIIRMLRHIVGEEGFRAGLQSYLRSRSFKEANSTHLYKAFDDLKLPYLPDNVSAIMSNWTYKSGFPILNVAVKGENVTFSQKRYLMNETQKDDTKWFIPISLTTSIKPDFSDTKPSVWLTPNADKNQTKIDKKSEWVIVNLKSAGYYRVNYDSETWIKLARALDAKDASGIPPTNRAQVVDDALNLARIGAITYEKAFQVLDFLKKETGYLPWVPAFNGYKVLLQRTRKTKIGDALADQLKRMMALVYKDVSANTKTDDALQSLKQELVWSWACKLGNGDCTKQSLKLFGDQMSNSNNSVPVNLRTGVYCSVIRSYNNNTAWDYLWKRYTDTSSSTEKNTILNALGCSQNKTLLTEYLKKSITADSGIRKQDSFSVFSAVINGNPDGVDTAFEFVSTNWANVSAYYKGFNSINKVLTALGEYLSTGAEIEKFENFVKDAGLTDELKQAADKAIENMKFHKKWTDKYSEQLEKYFGLEPDSATTVSTSFFIVALSVILFMFY